MPTSQLILEWQTAGGTRERIAFDASLSEGYESSAEATEHAVESGTPTTDHVKPNARTFTIEAWVTNSPLATPATQADGATGTVRAATIRVGGRDASVNVLQFTQPLNRVRAIDALLDQLVTERTLLKLYTGLRVVENVVLQRYKAERSIETGRGLPVTLEFKQLRIATTRRVAAPRRVRRPQQRGPQPTAPAPLQSGLVRLRNLRNGT